MNTNHVDFVEKTSNSERPQLFEMKPEFLVKGKYQEGEQLCMTGWMLELFLNDEKPYVQAYKEFRTKMMDVMYRDFSEDHASTAEDRSKVWNTTARELGYKI